LKTATDQSPSSAMRLYGWSFILLADESLHSRRHYLWLGSKKREWHFHEFYFKSWFSKSKNFASSFIPNYEFERKNHYLEIELLLGSSRLSSLCILHSSIHFSCYCVNCNCFL